MDYKNKWWIFSSVAMGVFLSTIDQSAVNLALPTLVKELHSSFGRVQYVVLGYVIPLAATLLIFGRLGDLFGKKKIYLVGMILFTFTSVMCAFAPTDTALILFRSVQGLAAAMMTALGTGIVAEAFPAKERGKALGTIGTIVSIGIISGPVLGGFLITLYGWRSVFFINLPIGIIGVVLVTKFMESAPRVSSNAKFDFSIFRQSNFSLNLASGFFNFILMAGVSLLMPFYLQNILMYDTQKTGLILTAVPILMGVVSPISGTLSDQIGTRKVSFAGLLVLFIGYASLLGLNEKTTTFEYMSRFFIIGAGMGLFQSPNNSSIMSAVPLSLSGTASSFVSFARTFGSAVGAAAFGHLWQARVIAREGEKGQNFLGALHSPQILALHDVFFFAIIIIIISVLCAVFAVKLENKQKL